jgi:hypothetical protein
MVQACFRKQLNGARLTDRTRRGGTGLGADPKKLVAAPFRWMIESELALGFIEGCLHIPLIYMLSDALEERGN